MRAPFDEIAQFKVGTVFYECEAGMNIEARVTSEPVLGEGYEGRRVLTWEAVNTQNDEPISYRLTEGLEHYGPRIYGQPKYVRVNKGGWEFPLLGKSS